jgi:hypothetical protein
MADGGWRMADGGWRMAVVAGALVEKSSSKRVKIFLQL